MIKITEYLKRILTTMFLFFILIFSLKGQDAKAIKELASETISNYYSLLNNLGDTRNTVEEKKQIKEAVIREYGDRYKTIVYNDLNSKGTTNLKLPEYLGIVISAFPQGVIFNQEIVKIFDLQAREDLMGFYCKVVVKTKIKIPNRKRAYSNKQLIFNINFEQIGKGTYGEQKILSIDLCDDDCFKSENIEQEKRNESKKKSKNRTKKRSKKNNIDTNKHTDTNNDNQIFEIEKLNDKTITIAELGINLAKVPGGNYTIGCEARRVNCDEDELPTVRVSIKGFYIMEKEVTNGQFAQFLEDYGEDYVKKGKYRGEIMIRPSSLGLKKINGKWIPKKGMENHPVVNVTWYGANQFAQFYGLSLPTEAQWEAAARGGKKSNPYIYSGGESIYGLAIYYDNSSLESANVGSTIPNQLDIYDLSGNVREWCLDWYKKDAYKNRFAYSFSPSGTLKVVRGGSYVSNDWDCRIYERNFKAPDSQDSDLGFRCVKNIK